MVHAGPWVQPPYKGIAEAEDCRTSPAHAHIYVGVLQLHACVRVRAEGGGSGGVDGFAVPAGQLKYSAEVSIATAWDTRKP